MHTLFIGKPHPHPTHQDYVPSVFPSLYKTPQRKENQRFKRMEARRSINTSTPKLPPPSRQCLDTIITNLQSAPRIDEVDQEVTMNVASHQSQSDPQGAPEQHNTAPVTVSEMAIQTESLSTSDVTQQTDVQYLDLEKLFVENEDNNKKLRARSFSVTMIEANDKTTHFYTGLPSWVVFFQLYMFLSPLLTAGRSDCALSMENELFLVLVKLRLNLLFEDIASRFGVAIACVSRTIDKWLEVMYIRLKFLISWPSREVLRQNLPETFKQLYPQCVCVIDCSEIFIEMPVNFEARSKTYSNYKKHNTIKFLIAITPCGSICFLSQCWGGRVSDKSITLESRFLSHLKPGDVVLVDSSFTVSDDLAIYGAKLEIPAFTTGKQQLSQREVELSKQLSRVRIHVERIIGLRKNKYTILKGPLPTNILKHNGDIDIANVDKILVVCAALTNLSPVV